MQKAQEDSHHLWQFVRDAGIEVQTGGHIYVKDLWEQLREWYQVAGILEVEYNEKGKEKLIWHDLSNKYDIPVKAKFPSLRLKTGTATSGYSICLKEVTQVTQFLHSLQNFAQK